VCDAPPLPADVVERIRQRARRRVGLDSAAPVQQASRRRFWIRPAVAAVVAAVLVGMVGAEAVTGSEMVRRLLRLVPGAGFAETDGESLVNARPVTIKADGYTATVTGLVSDGKQTRVWLRLDGLSPSGVLPPWAESNRQEAYLDLPDGRRLFLHRSSVRSSGGIATMECFFEPLPPGTKSVTLHLSTARGQSSLVAEIPLTDAATAHLPEPRSGRWSDERKGVRLVVSHLAFDGEMIRLQMESEGPAKVRFLDPMFFERRAEGISLTDDTGQTYPLVVAVPGRPLYADLCRAAQEGEQQALPSDPQRCGGGAG
jgi:hypothetical protein